MTTPHRFKTGSENPRWNGGKCIASGYVLVKSPGHPNARKDGRILEHRLVMATHIGRPIAKDEVVHHRNGNRRDNRLENLELFKRSAHTSLHTKGNVKPASIAALKGRTSDEMRLQWQRARAHKRRGRFTCHRCGKNFESRQHKPKYCCHDCYLAHQHPRHRKIKNCEVCGAVYKTRGTRRRFCSRSCYDRHHAAAPSV